MPHRFHSSVASLEQRLQQDRITLVKLAWFDFFSGSHKLVASRNDRRIHFAADEDLRETLRREQGECRRMKTLAFGDDFLAFSQIATTAPNKIARIDIYVHGNLASLTRHILLHHDRVRASGHWRASENPNRFSGRNAKSSI